MGAKGCKGNMALGSKGILITAIKGANLVKYRDTISEIVWLKLDKVKWEDTVPTEGGGGVCPTFISELLNYSTCRFRSWSICEFSSLSSQVDSSIRELTSPRFGCPRFGLSASCLVTAKGVAESALQLTTNSTAIRTIQVSVQYCNYAVKTVFQTNSSPVNSIFVFLRV